MKSREETYTKVHSPAARREETTLPSRLGPLFRGRSGSKLHGPRGMREFDPTPV